jgi:thiosulfate reductase cytochrome b subunit
VQWLLVVIYLSAALSKITVGKAAWLNGYTMTFYLLLDGSTHHVPLAIALAFELTFVVCVLFPPATPAYLATGVALHTGIWVLLRAPFFQFLALYAAFAEPMREVLRRRAPSGSRPPSSTVWTVV